MPSGLKVAHQKGVLPMPMIYSSTLMGMLLLLAASIALYMNVIPKPLRPLQESNGWD